MIEFVVQVSNVTVTAAQDLFELLAPAVRSVKLLEAHATQNTEFGDAQAEQLRFAIKLVTGAPTSGSGGTTPTPVSIPPGITYSGTVEANNTTRITGGTITILEPHSEHVANGWHYVAAEGKEYEIEGATRFIIGLEAAPADTINLDIALKFGVVGGI